MNAIDKPILDGFPHTRGDVPWGQRDISVERVLEVIGRDPLYGHITGNGHNTLWAVFVKLEGESK